MAAEYLSEAEIQAHIGTPVLSAIQTISGFSLTVLVNGASSLVRQYAQKNGYDLPTDDDPTSVENDIKMATMGALWPMLIGLPGAKVSLPENWERHPTNVMLQSILANDVPLQGLTPNTASAVGGFKGVSSSTYEQLSSRDELESW